VEFIGRRIESVGWLDTQKREEEENINRGFVDAKHAAAAFDAETKAG
jgi:hypothetical protein